MSYEIEGWVGAFLEVLLYYLVARFIRCQIPNFQKLPSVLYYWFGFTILTGFWETIYITQYASVEKYAEDLVSSGEHVWTRMYPLSMVLPNKLAKLFYAEYGAHADREYMSKIQDDYWSRLIESSHALLCGAFCLTTLVCVYNCQHMSKKMSRGAITWAAAGMGGQFMNSLLYMGEYFLQCSDKDSPNYVTAAFPLGPWMLNRWFMWVNALWMLLPAIILLRLICTD